MASLPPATKDDFKSRFARDFKYGAGSDKVMDADIDAAMADAMTMFNSALFSTADGKTAFLYATAHFLVTNVQAVGGLQAKPEGLGIQNEADGMVAGKGVNGINISYVQPPDMVVKSPALRQFWSTMYGQRYLGMLVPKLVGPFGAIYGHSDTEGSPDVPFAEY